MQVLVLTQRLRFARSPQWYHERPNREFSKLEKVCFRYIPLWQRYHRLSLFRGNDALVETYGAGEKAQRVRTATENAARNYIYHNAPEKYHHFIVPEFPLGKALSLYQAWNSAHRQCRM